MKTFKDLIFEKDFGSGYLRWDGSKVATITFPNGYGVKVGQGMKYHSSDDTYEIIIIKNGFEYKDTQYKSDTLRYLYEDEVTYIMIKIQEL